MSRNAYRVIKVVTAKNPSFNMSWDEELVDILQESANIFDYFNSYGQGIFSISEDDFKEVKEKLEKLIYRLKSTKTNQPESRESAKSYRKLLNEMEKEIKKKGYISYDIW